MRPKFHYSRWFLAAAVILLGTLATPSANANPIPCSTMSAAALASLGTSGCQFGSVIFYDFSYSYDNSVSPAEPASAVTIQFSDAGANPLLPVLSLLGNWDAQNDDITDLRVNYSVAVVGPPITITGGNMTIAGNFGNQIDSHGGAALCCDTIGGSFVSAAETISEDVPGSGSVPVNANIGPYADNSDPSNPIPIDRTWGPDSAFSGNQFFADQTQISVAKDVQIFAGDKLYTGSGPGPDDGQLLRIDEGLILTSGPEPAVYIYLGSGLIAMRFLLRRQSARNKRS